MRRALLAGTAVFIGLGAQSAWADVDVLATIIKDKDITVVEFLDKIKTVTVNVSVVVAPDKSAESLALVNQTNHNNEACENCAEKRDELVNSIGQVGDNGNSGIVTVNQAAGNMNNQGNNLAVAVDFRKGTPGGPGGGGGPGGEAVDNGFAEAQASTDQKTFANVVDTINLLFRDALISGSINGNDGIVLVNQAPGNVNNQANNVSMAVSFAETAGVALAEADLGQLNTGNRVRESDSTGTAPIIGINKSARVAGSINNNTGIVAANQAAGNMANQSNTLAMAVVTF